jgi:glycine/D-amino acid oxidase-like deaminating enzyme
MPYIDTWYRRTLADGLERPSLSGARDADFCIVGGGLAGLTAALTLARAGRSVVVLEAERIGWGASGRNGGFVGPSWAAGADVIARRTSPHDGKALQRLSIEGMEFVRHTIDQLRIESAAPVHGKLGVLRYPADDALKARRDMLARDFDYHVDFVPRETVRDRLRSTKYHAALRDPRAFHFHPLNYLRAIAREIERLGGLVFERSAVTSIGRQGASHAIGTSQGTVRSGGLLLATGGYTGDLVPDLRRAMLPIATYVLVTEAAPECLAEAVRTTDAISDNRRAGNYYRLIENGQRLLWGGKITTRRSDPADLAELLRRDMVSTFPQLDSVKVDLAWSGLMSYARHLMPQIGKLAEGIWYCTAFGGHGMNTTAIGGQVVAEAMLGSSDRIRLFAPFGLDWNGGVVGTAAVQATYWNLMAQDWWKERKAG